MTNYTLKVSLLWLFMYAYFLWFLCDLLCPSHPPLAILPKQTCLHFPNLSHLVLINLPPLCFQVFTACLQVSDVKMCFLFISFPPWHPRASLYSFLWTPPQHVYFPTRLSLNGLYLFASLLHFYFEQFVPKPVFFLHLRFGCVFTISVTGKANVCWPFWRLAFLLCLYFAEVR